jgi:hypothetical protein
MAGLPVTSRYFSVGTEHWQAADGREVVYFKRRFAPAGMSLPLLAIHIVTQGERLDNVTARYLGDPEQFWRLCDANDAMQPDSLVARIGRRLRIPLPQGSA